MKKLRTLAIVSVVAVSPMLGSAIAHAAPGGSYTQSCTNITFDGESLHASCRTISGTWTTSTLWTPPCLDTNAVNNNNGQLVCDQGNWVQYSSGVSYPSDDNGVYGVCSAWYGALGYAPAWHPGKIYQDRCWFAYSNYYVNPLLSDPKVRVLRNYNGPSTYHWVSVGSNNIPPSNGVHSTGQERGKTLYVCEGYVNDPIDPNSRHPGKFVDGYCYYAWGNGARRDRVSDGGWVKILVPN